MHQSRRRLTTLLAATAISACALAPAAAQATTCPTSWKLIKSKPAVDHGVRFGYVKVYRQPHKRSVCAQASIRKGWTIDTIQIFQGKNGYAQRNGSKFVFYTLPGTRKRFSVGLTARHKGGVFSDTFYPSL